MDAAVIAFPHLTLAILELDEKKLHFIALKQFNAFLALLVALHFTPVSKSVGRVSN